MKIKVTRVIDTNSDDEDMVGEMLRGEFFDQTNGLGCYSSFEYAQGVKFLGRNKRGGQEWYDLSKRISGALVFCSYYWDGDGYLEFHLPDGIIFYNSDCKKTYRWKCSKTTTNAA